MRMKTRKNYAGTYNTYHKKDRKLSKNNVMKVTLMWINNIKQHMFLCVRDRQQLSVSIDCTFGLL